MKDCRKWGKEGTIPKDCFTCGNMICRKGVLGKE